MACERPVIASDAGGIPDAVKHGESGVLVSRTQLHRLGEACLDFLQLDADRQEAIRQSARKAILRKFTPSHEMVRLRELITRTLESP